MSVAKTLDRPLTRSRSVGCESCGTTGQLPRWLVNVGDRVRLTWLNRLEHEGELVMIDVKGEVPRLKVSGVRPWIVFEPNPMMTRFKTPLVTLLKPAPSAT